eukprot:sb/3469825/
MLLQTLITSSRRRDPLITSRRHPLTSRILIFLLLPNTCSAWFITVEDGYFSTTGTTIAPKHDPDNGTETPIDTAIATETPVTTFPPMRDQRVTTGKQPTTIPAMIIKAETKVEIEAAIPTLPQLEDVSTSSGIGEFRVATDPPQEDDGGDINNRDSDRDHSDDINEGPVNQPARFTLPTFDVDWLHETEYERECSGTGGVPFRCIQQPQTPPCCLQTSGK